MENPTSSNNYESGLLERNYTFINTNKFNTQYVKFNKGLEKNELNNYLCLFYLKFEETFQDKEYFILLLKNEMYYECMNLLEMKLAKIKDAEASNNSLEETSFSYDKRQIILIRIYIYCYIKIEFLQSGKIFNLKLDFSSVCDRYIKSETFDNNYLDDFFYHFTEYFDNFDYGNSGNLTSIFNSFNSYRNTFLEKIKIQNILNKKENNIRNMQRINTENNIFNRNNLSLFQNNLKSEDNIFQNKNEILSNAYNSKISIGNFSLFFSEITYHFSSLICNLRTLYIKIELYRTNNSRGKLDSNVIGEELINNKINSKYSLREIEEATNESCFENQIIKEKKINIDINQSYENNIQDKVRKKKYFEEIQESIFNIIKYSEFFEKFIFTTFYLNKNLKTKISRTHSIFEFEQKIFNDISEEDNLFNLSLNEDLFFNFNKISNIFKNFIEENFISFIIEEMQNKNHENKENNNYKIMKFTNFCHSQKFDLKNLSKAKYDTQGKDGLKNNLEKNNKTVNKIKSNDSLIDDFVNANEIKNSKKEIEIDLFNFSKIEPNNIMNNTYSYRKSTDFSFDFNGLNRVYHSNNYNKYASLKDLDSKIQLIFLDLLHNSKGNFRNNTKMKKLNTDNSFLSCNNIGIYNRSVDQITNKIDNNLNNDNYLINNYSGLIKCEDIFSLKISRCIMNVIKNLDLEIQILIAIIKNQVEERKNYNEVIKLTIMLFELFVKKYLDLENIPNTSYEYEQLLFNKKLEFEKKNNQNKIKKNFTHDNDKGILDPIKLKKAKNEKAKNDEIIEPSDENIKFISSEVYAEILETLKIIISNYDNFKHEEFLKKNVLGFYKEFKKYFDSSISQNKIKLRFIEINGKLNNSKDIEKYKDELKMIMNNM